MTYLLLKPMRKFVCLLLARALLLCGGPLRPIALLTCEHGLREVTDGNRLSQEILHRIRWR